MTSLRLHLREAAKAYYRQAYKEGHDLARKTLKEWNK